MSTWFKILLLLSILFIAGIIIFNTGYDLGYEHGFIDATLKELVSCIESMNKLAETLR